MPHSVEMPQQATIVIPMEDPILHNEGHPFCNQADCPCREDFDNILLLHQLIHRGLLTQDEAELVLRGATI